MKTLNRPMFNMGGPIKQGIMHGIREPHKDGKIVGGHQSPLLAGAHPWKDKSGREHHLLPAGWAAAAGFARFAPALYRALSAGKNISKAGNIVKNVGGASGAGTGWTGSTALTVIPKAPVRTVGQKIKGWFTGDPLYKTIAGGTTMGGRAAKWLGKKGYGAAKYGLTTPSGLALTAAGTYGFWPDGTKKTDEEIAQTGGVPGGGDKGMYYEASPKKLSEAERKAFATKQREERVNKYLDMMGYDRAKKTAIADALIDASKIVSDRGTLDPKNITQELINPIIQATSKRLDKPGQIREAVGLMMTKAGLEKEMYDAKPGTVLKNVQDMVKSGKYTEEEAWAIATKGSQGVVADLQGAIATGKVDMANWPSFVMATGAQHGEEVTHVTDAQLKEQYKDADRIPSAMEIITEREKTEVVPDGIYVIGQETVRIKGGKKTQIK